jgi:hypothetical protein
VWQVVMTPPVAGDTPDGPRSNPKDRHLCFPEAALHHARFPIYREFVDARAGDDADVYRVVCQFLSLSAFGFADSSFLSPSVNPDNDSQRY